MAAAFAFAVMPSPFTPLPYYCRFTATTLSPHMLGQATPLTPVYAAILGFRDISKISVEMAMSTLLLMPCQFSSYQPLPIIITSFSPSLLYDFVRLYFKFFCNYVPLPAVSLPVLPRIATAFSLILLRHIFHTEYFSLDDYGRKTTPLI